MDLIRQVHWRVLFSEIILFKLWGPNLRLFFVNFFNLFLITVKKNEFFLQQETYSYE